VAFLFFGIGINLRKEAQGRSGAGDPAKQNEGRFKMGRIDPQLVAQRLREVVADEPKAFAYDIGVSLSALYNYLNGRIPSTEVLFRIACYTGRPMEWFLATDRPSSFDMLSDVRVGHSSLGLAQ
jgi:transcriptional regulator with XRE-family HTH domain